MNNSELVFHSVEELARYLNSRDGDVQVHIKMEIGQERGDRNGEEEGDRRPVFQE